MHFRLQSAGISYIGKCLLAEAGREFCRSTSGRIDLLGPVGSWVQHVAISNQLGVALVISPSSSTTPPTLMRWRWKARVDLRSGYADHRNAKNKVAAA
jgi:hypothetical protein